MQGARYDRITQNPSHRICRSCGSDCHGAGVCQRCEHSAATRRCPRLAPNFVGISKWFNSAPLSISDLRGKVVLVDFWTYDCYNCVNTLPYVTKLYETYKDKGLVVVGIHTPEFPFERSAGNVQAALKRHGITYPVAQDNDSATWNAWRNQYWPAQYIVDQHGQIVFSHAGEGQYDEIKRAVQRLLNATS